MDLTAIKKRLLVERGFDCEQYSDSFFKRRIATRLRAHGVSSYDDYALILRRDPDEYEKLWRALTINVTRFFRDGSVWDVIEKKVIPELLSIKGERGEKTLRVWSAGCSTGEEAYSIAILLKPYVNKAAATIYGTDRDSRGLEKAAEGVYGPFSLENVKPKCLSSFDHRDGRYEVKDDIKRMVKFMRHDLLEDEYHKKMDLILCRNVLIYFKRGAQKEVVSHFYESLRDHGYLVMGKVETLFDEVRGGFVPVDIKERIYQKD